MSKKIKELHLRYTIEDFNKMLEIKEKKKMTWEDLIYFAIRRLK